MARQRHLEKAPITEALVDFRVSLPKDFQPAVFADLKPQLSDRYPTVQEVRSFEAKFEITPGKTHTQEVSRGTLQGIFFKSQDGLNIAQFRADGFTYNRLRPYTSWAELFPEARRLWQLYVSVTRPAFVSRVALRFINHLSMQLKWGDDLEKYLEAFPPMPPGAPGGFSGFVSKVSTYDPETGLAANVGQAIEGPPKTSIVLDIDVFKEGEFDTGAGIDAVFQSLHELKNKIFFGTITEETARLYE